MAKPRVSVIIDTYNHERFIEQAIVSVLDQDFPRAEMEVLVVDDGSTDRTPEILHKFQPHIRVLRKPNGGQASAFNAAIPNASGEFVAFLDADDWWLPNKLTRVMQAFADEPALGLVGHGEVFSYSDGREMVHSLHEDCQYRANTLAGARLFRLRKSFLGTSRMTFRTEALKRTLPVPEILTIQADEFIFTLGAVQNDVRILSEALCFYRIHEANSFHMSTHDDRSRMKRKQQVLAALAQHLRNSLQSSPNVQPAAANAIVESIQADADQLRLMLEGGWPWETVRTEWKISEVMFENPRPYYRIFKLLSLLPALAMPPKLFYGARHKIARSDLYHRARKKWLPMPEMSHIQKNWRTGA